MWVCPLARTVLPARAFSSCALCAAGMTKTAGEVLAESIDAYLAAERGGQVLTPLVVGLLTKHYVKLSRPPWVNGPMTVLGDVSVLDVPHSGRLGDLCDLSCI